MIHDDIKKIYITEEEIQVKTLELAKQINVDYDNKRPVLIGLLKGCTNFMMDLIKRVDLYLETDYMDVTSYHGTTQSSGIVTIDRDLKVDIKGRHVLIVEDIVDTGFTLKKIIKVLKDRGAASVKTVSLLDKPSGRKVEVSVEYIGFTVENEFFVGYGLDYREEYRNLPYVGILKPEVYSK